MYWSGQEKKCVFPHDFRFFSCGGLRAQGVPTERCQHQTVSATHKMSQRDMLKQEP